MQLVPAIINNYVPHVGGKRIAEQSIAKKKDKNIFPGPNEIDNYRKLCK